MLKACFFFPVATSNGVSYPIIYGEGKTDAMVRAYLSGWKSVSVDAAERMEAATYHVCLYSEPLIRTATVMDDWDPISAWELAEGFNISLYENELPTFENVSFT